MIESTIELSQKILKTTEVLGEIEQIRKRNNANWMDLARLAFEVAPERARAIMAKITEADSDINRLTKELSK